MRSTFVLLILGAAACGGSNNSTPDASTHHDGPVQIDASPDAAPDAPADAPPDSPPDGMGSGSATATRVWAVGDFATNGTRQAGWFTDGDTLPVTPTLVPAAPAVLPSTSGYTTYVFDATTTKTAYVADITTAGTFDLYVADADGANPALLVAGQAGVEIANVAVSPDGTKVAFMMDSTALDGAYDVWFVNTTGTPVPVLVSPTRNVMAPDLAALSAFTGSLKWSADSKYIGFSGDFTTDGVSQPYAVDTTAATPAAVELVSSADIGTNGIRGDIAFDANDKAYFRVGSGTQFGLYQVDADGQNLTTLALPARGDATASSVGSFALSPDGTMIVFSADAPTATSYDVYSTALATWNPVKLTNATLPSTNPPFSAPFAFSPDGTQVAFVADYITDNVNEPFVAAVDGSAIHRVVNVTVTNADAEQVWWTADGTGLYVEGDLETNNDTTVFRADPSMTDGTATKAITVASGGDVTNLLVRAK